MRIIILITLLVILSLSMWFIWPKKRLVISSVDQRGYRVNHNSVEAADTLAALHKRMITFSEMIYASCNGNCNHREATKRLIDRIYDVKIEERSVWSKHTSYSVGKGEKIVFCMRDKSGKIHDMNLLFYVALHEMAHIACKEYHHTPLFKSIFFYFIEFAAEKGLYRHIDFNNLDIPYCGMVL